MARVTEGSRSGLSGKADGMVYSNVNGQTIVRKAPRFKKDSFTPGMLLNQQRFREVNSFCARFKDSVIPQIWNGTNKRMSGYALFLKTNMPAFGRDGTLEDVTRIRLSMGNLAFPQGFEARRSETDNNRVEVSWPKELHVGGVHLKDELMLISAGDGEYSDILDTGILRGQLGGSFELPVLTLLPAPSPMHLYLFFGSKDHRDYSESVCFEV